jgi:hypothetical protein
VTCRLRGLTRSADLFRQLDNDPLRTADVAEPVAILVLLKLADEFGAVSPQALKGIVDALYRERDMTDAQRVRRTLRQSPVRSISWPRPNGKRRSCSKLMPLLWRTGFFSMPRRRIGGAEYAATPISADADGRPGCHTSRERGRSLGALRWHGAPNCGRDAHRATKGLRARAAEPLRRWPRTSRSGRR